LKSEANILTFSMEMSSISLDSEQAIVPKEGKKQKSRLQNHAPATLQLKNHQRGSCSFENCAIPLLSPLTLASSPSVLSVPLVESTDCCQIGSSGEQAGALCAGNRLQFPWPGQEWWNPASPMQIAEPLPIISLAQDLQ
jgi:hypothetical protein